MSYSRIATTATTFFVAALLFCVAADAQHRGLYNTDAAGSDVAAAKAARAANRTPSMSGHRAFHRVGRPANISRSTGRTSGGVPGAAAERGGRSSHFARLPTAPRTARPTRSVGGGPSGARTAPGSRAGRSTGTRSFGIGRVGGKGGVAGW